MVRAVSILSATGAVNCSWPAIQVSDVRELLTEALERWGTPAGVVADRFKKAELIGHLNALDFDVDVVLRGMGFRDGAEDVRGFQLAALDRVT